MKVLQVSQDRMVLQSRAMLLMQALPGCEVVSATTYADAITACALEPFALVILGTGLSDSDKMKLAQHVRGTMPQAKLVEIHRGMVLLKADLDWEAGIDPQAFVVEVKRLMNRLGKGAAATPKT